MARCTRLFCCLIPISASILCLVATEVSDSVQVARLQVKEWNTHKPGDIHCFCNLPVCVTTSYMCKSEGSGCFSDFMDYSMDVYKARHGCLELLSSDRHEQCHNQPGPGGNGHGHHKSLLLCCHKDMCNHVDSPDVRLRFNDTFMGTVNSSEGARLYFNGAQNPAANYNNEVWFKAATIAVPICGIVILFILIALAVKMLRKDSIEQGLIHSGKHNSMFPHTGHAMGLGGSRKPVHDHLHFHRNAEMSSKKVPLLLQHHNEATTTNHGPGVTLVPPISRLQFEKNEANAKLNFAGNSGSQRSQHNDYTLLVHPQNQNSQNSNIRKANNANSNNLYRNVNLAVVVPTPQSFPVDGKLYDKQPLTSVVSWGSASDSASHV
ncbi:uncharacterized protein [Anabrus simplex]|uniref:uncharacterized protein n=1 Tax=Anabrus simplex TaxID=316456 RepID=UPI0034DD08C1